MNQTLSWGILGTADNARKNWRAIALSGNGTVAGVGSRDLGRSQRFIEDCQVEIPMTAPPRAFGSYDELLRSDSIQAVYVPLPTGVRKEWVLRAADAGKHVVCEKPCARNLTDLREMIEACRRADVQFMDGVMFMHSTRMVAMRSILADGTTIGPLRRLQTAFTFNAPSEFMTSNIRTNADLEPDGCLGDLGWYCIRFMLWAMSWKMPRSVTGRLLHTFTGNRGSPGVPAEFVGELSFSDDVTASFFCSFRTGLQQWAILGGPKGYLKVSDFVLPYAGEQLGFEVHLAEFIKNGCDFRMAPGIRNIFVPEHSHGHPTAQEARMFRNFGEVVLPGRREPAWAEWSLKTQSVMCACRQSAAQGGKPVELVSV